MKKTPIDLQAIYKLAELGLTVTLIADTMGISRSTIYKHKDIIHTIKRGHSEARKKVITNLMERSADMEQSATASIFLAKQLKVYDTYFPTGKPKNIKQAITKITDVYTAYAHSEIDSEKADRLIRYLETYIKAFEASEHETRISKLEEIIK